MVRYLASILLFSFVLGNLMAESVYFGDNPADLKIPDGETAEFASAELENGSYQWYRVPPGGGDGVALAGATGERLSFTAVLADDGARFYCIAEGEQVLPGDSRPIAVGPTASRSALLNVVTGDLPPTIREPDEGKILRRSEVTQRFQAEGVGLSWSFRFSAEDAGIWHQANVQAPAQQANLLIDPTTVGLDAGLTGLSFSIRIEDDEGRRAERTWAIADHLSQPPEAIYAAFGAPYFMVFPGGQLVVDAGRGFNGNFVTDPDGDASTLTIHPHQIEGLSVNADGSFTYRPPVDLAIDSAEVDWEDYNDFWPAENNAYRLTVIGHYHAVDAEGLASEMRPIAVLVLTGPGDLDRNGTVDERDLKIVTGQFGTTYPSPAEP